MLTNLCQQNTQTNRDMLIKSLLFEQIDLFVNPNEIFEVLFFWNCDIGIVMPVGKTEKRNCMISRLIVDINALNVCILYLDSNYFYQNI